MQQILLNSGLEEAERLCKNVALLNHGRVAALDSTAALLKQFSGERIKFSLGGHILPESFPIACQSIGNGFFALENTGSESLRRLLNALDAFGLQPEGLELGQANLEEVFLRLTHDAA